MSEHITAHRDGFPAGFTAVTRFDDPQNDAGISFGRAAPRGRQTMESEPRRPRRHGS